MLRSSSPESSQSAAWSAEFGMVGEGGEAIGKSTAGSELSAATLCGKTSDRGMHMGVRHMRSSVGGAGSAEPDCRSVPATRGCVCTDVGDTAHVCWTPRLQSGAASLTTARPGGRDR
ncbi:hypothetical protein BC2230_10880 [Burkholderia cepacia]